MERILKIALEAELKAQNIIDEAEQQKARCDKSIAEAGNIEAQYLERAKKRVAEYEQKERQHADAENRKEDEKLQQSLERLENEYRTYGAEWVDTLYRAATDKP